MLALGAAIGFGASDFAGGLASRSGSVVPVSLLVSAVGALVIVAALPLTASPAPSAAALAWGFGAGLSTTLGVFALYLGFRYAAFSVAGPLSAVGAAGFSVLAGLLLGERPADLALAGIALALPAIVAVSASAASADDTPEREAAIPGGRPVAGVVLGLVAGACFALLYIGLDRAGPDSGLWPVAGASAGELVVALAAALVTRGFRWPAPGRGCSPRWPGRSGRPARSRSSSPARRACWPSPRCSPRSTPR
jgi:drug/metabolite transporter (DMT)-like permease